MRPLHVGSRSRVDYGPSSRLREARARYFADAGLPEDGGYGEKWIRVATRLPLYIRNTAPRRRAVPYHDLHHVLTGYDTSSTGEAEISAWELAAGTRPHWIATLLDLAGLATGLLIAPQRTYRAYVRGRRSRSLYRESLTPALLDSTVDEVRSRLGIPEDEPAGTLRDALSFAALSAVALATLAAFVVLAPLLVLVGPFLR